MSEVDLDLTEDVQGDAESAQDDEDGSDDLDAQEDTQEAPEGQAEPVEASEAPGMTPEALDRLRKKIETSANTWRKRLADLLGEDFELLAPCELCGDEFPGFHWPADVMQPNTDTQARLLEVLREPAAPDYLPDGRVTQCRQCGGWGKTLSGSKKVDKAVITCVQCKGFGYTPPPDARAEGGSVASGQGWRDGQPIGAEPGDPGTLEHPEGEVYTGKPPWEDRSKPDPNGSPGYLEDGSENPNWGKWPQMKDPSLP